MVQVIRTLLSLGLLASASAYKTWSVTVGNETGAALFNPISLVCVSTDISPDIVLMDYDEQSGVASGDEVVFTFSPMNHTVTQSSFAQPCRPLPGGFDTGLYALISSSFIAFINLRSNSNNPVAIGAPLWNRPTFTHIMNGVRLFRLQLYSHL